MATPPIKFGTDGWRAIIAKDYTFDNLEIVTRATAQWLKKNYGDTPSVVMGHDTRFLGPEFTEFSARIFASLGVSVTMAEGFTSTPAISWAALGYEASAGIVITASHNPPQYNGFKIKADFGGPATPDMIAAVEAEMLDLAPADGPLPSLEALMEDGMIRFRDVTADYLNVLRDRLDIDAITSSDLKVAHDAMYGAGQGMVAALIGEDRVVGLHQDYNPGFMGQAPEPISKNLGGLSELVVREGCAIGIANDGDADRIGMYDENGDFVNSHLLLALLIKYLHQERNLTGDVIKTYSTTHMLDRIGEAYGLTVQTTPIGFKYIAGKIVEGDVIVGGEESGGMAVKGHIPERDGIYIGLLMAEMVVKRGKPLSALVQELYDEFGGHYTYRNDVHTTNENKAKVLEALAAGGLKTIAGRTVNEVGTLDGFKHFADGGWLLVRASGTEPDLRGYSGSDSTENAKASVDDDIVQLGLG